MIRTLIAVASLSVTGAAFAQCTPDWLPGRTLLDFDDVMVAAAPWDPDGAGPAPALLAIFGQAYTAGDVFIRRAAAWDGLQYQPMGDDFLHQGSIQAACVFEGDLYVSGGFSQPGHGIVRWNGQDWVGFGAPARVWAGALTVHDGELIAAGSMALTGTLTNATVAAWNGTAWRELGNSPTGSGRALASTPEGLFMGGEFPWNPGSVIHHVYYWDGTEWLAVGQGLGGSRVQALAWHDGALYAGGNFTINTVPIGLIPQYLARLNGGVWEEVQGILPGISAVDTRVNALRSHDDHLYIGGRFTLADGRHSVARLQGNTVSAAGEGVTVGKSWPGIVQGFSEFQGELIAVGDFARSGGHELQNIARFSGGQWLPLAEGNAGTADELEMHEGQLYAAGTIRRFEGVNTRGIARKDSGGWTALPELPGAPSVDVRAIISFDGKLVAAGDPGTLVFAWENGQWSPMSEGLSGGGSDIHSFGTFQGELIAAGSMTVQNISTKVARWDGAAWQPLNGTAAMNSSAWCIHEHDGVLYAGGSFNKIGGDYSTTIARWDGTRWWGVGDPNMKMTGAFDLVTFENALTAGVSIVDNNIRYAVLRWNGLAWEQMGDNLPFRLNTLEVIDGQLYAAGEAWYGTTESLARWTGMQWELLGGSGYSEIRELLKVESEGLIYAAGTVRSPTGPFSVGISRFGCPSCYANCDGSTGSPVLSIADFACFLDRFTAGDPYANCDGSTAAPTLNIADFGCFLGKFAAGCP